MIDEKFLDKLKQKMDLGPENANVDDILLVLEFYKQISEINEDLKEELEDMDIGVQQITTDIDKEFWLTIEDGKLKYGEGKLENPSFTFFSTKEILAGILYGEVDMTSAYMAGDITVEGNLQDAMAFQEIIELSLEAYEDLLAGEDSTIDRYPRRVYYSKYKMRKSIPLRIENLQLVNFKSFKQLDFSLRKINIIMGPNNSGKSNILRSMLLLKQTFTSSLTSSLLLNGNILSLGSFKDITYNFNEKDIILKLIIDIRKNKIYETLIRFNSELSSLKELNCQFVYSFDAELDTIILKEFRLLDKSEKNTIFKSLIKPEDIIINNKTRLNFLEELEQSQKNLLNELKEFINFFESFTKELKIKKKYEDFRYRIPSFSSKRILDKIIDKLEIFKFDFYIDNTSFLPELKISEESELDMEFIKRLRYELAEPYFPHIKPGDNVDVKVKSLIRRTNAFLNKFDSVFALSRLLTTIQQNFKEYFQNLFYIGPLRESPERYYPILGEIAKDVGFRGEYVPQLLKMIKEKTQYNEFNEKINYWLKNFEMVSKVIIGKYKEIPELISIICEEYFSGVQTNLNDMGFGTSQVLPIIIEGFLILPNSVLIVEQPEIHLHPKAQSTLGDLFIEIAKDDKILIIETHSEHLIRRIQRRIAENEISNDEVIFYYVTMNNEGSQLQKLDLNEDGYIKEIPDGFFEEDYKEVFKHLMSVAKKKEK